MDVLKDGALGDNISIDGVNAEAELGDVIDRTAIVVDSIIGAIGQNDGGFGGANLPIKLGEAATHGREGRIVVIGA